MSQTITNSAATDENYDALIDACNLLANHAVSSNGSNRGEQSRYAEKQAALLTSLPYTIERDTAYSKIRDYYTSNLLGSLGAISREQRELIANFLWEKPQDFRFTYVAALGNQ